MRHYPKNRKGRKNSQKLKGKNYKHLKKNLRGKKALAFIHTCIMPNGRWLGIVPPRRTAMIGGKDLLDRVGRSFGAAGVGDRVVLGVVGRGGEAGA